MHGDLRQPAVAGRFYTADARRLSDELAQFLTPKNATPVVARALLAPHAGYMYSGRIAGATYARVEVPDRVVVICPNHTGRGAVRSLWATGGWQLPGGTIPVDEELAELARRHARLTPDREAHMREHAIEVQLPFLRAQRSDVRVVPICLAGLTLEHCHDVGRGLARAIEALSSDVLIVASTDMSHYIAADEARRLDMMAIDRVLALDPDGLYEVVTHRDISMCGFIPTTVAIVAARALGATSAELVRYGNSGEVSGDLDQVVGYAGVIVR